MAEQKARLFPCFLRKQRDYFFKTNMMSWWSFIRVVYDQYLQNAIKYDWRLAIHDFSLFWLRNLQMDNNDMSATEQRLLAGADRAVIDACRRQVREWLEQLGVVHSCGVWVLSSSSIDKFLTNRGYAFCCLSCFLVFLFELKVGLLHQLRSNRGLRWIPRWRSLWRTRSRDLACFVWKAISQGMGMVWVSILLETVGFAFSGPWFAWNVFVDIYCTKGPFI